MIAEAPAGAPPFERERVTRCPLCGSSTLRPWRIGWDRSHLISELRFEYAQCATCGVYFESVRPPEREIARFYPDSYYEPRAPRARRRKPLSVRLLAPLNEAADRRLPDVLPGRLREAYAPAREGVVLLDYGCGSTDFLGRARERGWKTIGADVSDLVLRAVRESGHRAVAASPQALDEIDDGSVAMIRMNHVIEHLYDPAPVLSALFRKLERGGLLHVSTPNPRSWSSTLLRSRWLGLDCPRHVVLYPPQVLEAFLHRIGFGRVEIVHEVTTKDLSRSLGYVLHDLGRLRHDEIPAMAHRRALDAWLHVPARLAGRAGASDRLHAFAVR